MADTGLSSSRVYRLRRVTTICGARKNHRLTDRSMIMRKLLPTIFVASLMASTAAFAQTTTAPPPPASSAPTTVEKSTTPPASKSVPSESQALTLTDEKAKAWIDKAVYSSDGKNVGEVAAFERDASGKVTQMHIDIGGFLGLGQTRVRLMPSEFKLVTDRAILSLTAEQAKTLPIVQK